MDKYRIAIIDDNKNKLELISNDFEFNDPSFETIELIIDSKEWTKEKVIRILKEQNVDAVIVDYLLTSKNNGVDYNGDKIIQELSLEFRNLPIIMISEVEQEAQKSDMFPFLFIEREKFIDKKQSYIDKIHKTITTNRNMIKQYENDIINLLKKSKLSDNEKAKLVKLDNFLEGSLSYESLLPNYYKNNEVMDNLKGNMDLLDQILVKLNE